LLVPAPQRFGGGEPVLRLGRHDVQSSLSRDRLGRGRWVRSNLRPPVGGPSGHHASQLLKSRTLRIGGGGDRSLKKAAGKRWVFAGIEGFEELGMKPARHLEVPTCLLHEINSSHGRVCRREMKSKPIVQGLESCLDHVIRETDQEGELDGVPLREPDNDVGYRKRGRDYALRLSLVSIPVENRNRSKPQTPRGLGKSW
jgi:hypothetical protein